MRSRGPLSGPAFLLLAAAVATLGAASAAPRWISTGPAGANAIDLAEGADGRIYALVDEYANPRPLFVSDDGGASWRDLGRRIPARRVLSITTHPARPGTLVVNTDRDGLLRSDDGGKSWRRLDRGLKGDVLQVVFGPAPLHRLYATASKKAVRYEGNPRLYLYREKRGSWKKMTRFFGSYLVTHPTDPDLLYLFGKDPGTWRHGEYDLFRSEDGGSTWERAGTGFENRIAAKIVFASEDRRHLYASARPWNDFDNDRSDPGGFLESRDGKTWELVSELPLGGRQFLDFTVDPRNPKDILAAVGFGPPSVAHSRDGGRTWELAGLESRWIRDLLRSRFDPRVVFAASQEGIHRGTGSGRDWTLLEGARLNTAKIEHVAASAAGAGGDPWIYAANGALFRRRESGSRWARLETPDLHPRRVFPDPVDADRVYAVTRDGIARSSDAGETWRQVEFEGYGGEIVFDPRDRRRAYLARRGLWVTTDRGRSWKRLETPLDPHVDTVALRPDRPRVLLVGGERGVARSLDRGRTWGSPSFREVLALVADPHRASTVWAIAKTPRYDDGLYRSDDFGDSFRRVRGNGLPERAHVNAIVIDARDPDLIYLGLEKLLCGKTCGVLRSTDGGATWATFNRGGLEIQSVQSLAQSPTWRLHAGTEWRGVYSVRDRP